MRFFPLLPQKLTHFSIFALEHAVSSIEHHIRPNKTLDRLENTIILSDAEGVTHLWVNVAVDGALLEVKYFMFDIPGST